MKKGLLGVSLFAMLLSSGCSLGNKDDDSIYGVYEFEKVVVLRDGMKITSSWTTIDVDEDFNDTYCTDQTKLKIEITEDKIILYSNDSKTGTKEI